MIRTGWHARAWSDAYFKVLDVAALTLTLTLTLTPTLTLTLSLSLTLTLTKVLDVAARVGSGVGSYGVPPALLDIPISQRKGVANPSRRRTLTAARDHSCRPLFSLP